MTTQIIDNIPSWKRKLAIQREQIKRAVRHEDATFSRVRVAVDRYRDAHMQPITDLVGLTGNDAFTTKEALDNWNIFVAMEIELAFADFKSDTKGLDGETEKQTWAHRMKLAKEKAKWRVVWAYDLAYEGAIEALFKVPESGRDAAFMIFDLGQEYVGHPLDAFNSEMKTTFHEISAFTKGTWDALEDAGTTVDQAAQDAIDWIRGNFVKEIIKDPPTMTKRNDVDIKFKLQWQSQANQSDLVIEDIHQAARYVSYAITQTLADNSKIYVCTYLDLQSGPSGSGWETDMVINTVAKSDVMDTIETIEAVVEKEYARKEPFPAPDPGSTELDWSGVPTPNPVVYDSEFKLTMPTMNTAQVKAAQAMNKKRQAAAATLPASMRSSKGLTVNGHSGGPVINRAVLAE